MANDLDCSVGDRCLDTEALKDLFEGNGVRIPASTQKYFDGIRANIQVAQEMVGAAMNAYTASQEGGIFGIASWAVEEIGNAGSSTGNTPRALQAEFGDGAFIDAIEAHCKTIIPDDLSKFCENFSQIEQAVTQSAKSMYNAVQGATESITGLQKVASQFAPMAVGSMTGATFTRAANKLKTLGELPLNEGATAFLLETGVIKIPGVQKAALRQFGTLDLTDFTDEISNSLLSNITDLPTINQIQSLLKVPGKGRTAADFLSKTISSANAITDSEYAEYTNLFAQDYGALQKISELAETTGNLFLPPWDVEGQGVPPDTNTKVTDEGVAGVETQFGGGTGPYGEVTYRDIMGSVMGEIVTYDDFGNKKTEPSEWEKALEAYQNALNGNTSTYAMIRDACYGDWSQATASSDGGSVSGGGTNPADIPNTVASQITLNAALARLLPDMPDNNSADGPAAAVAAIMRKERKLWEKFSLTMYEGSKPIANVQAMVGFVTGLPSKMQDVNIKGALENCLTGAVKSLGNSAPFEKALSIDMGVTGVNRVSPRKD